MKKLNYFTCFIAVCILAVLYLLSSTDFILKEQVDTIYNISVIANDLNDEFFLNTRLGMEQALKEWKADVSFVSLYNRNNVEQQMEFILKEIENGAQAVIVFPVDSVKLSQLLEETVVRVPVISMGSSMESSKVSAVIQADDYGRGKALVELLAEKLGKDKGIVMMTDSYEHGDIKAFAAGITNACREAGIKNDLYTYEGNEDFYNILEEAVEKSEYGAFIGLDAQTLKLAVTKEYPERRDNMMISGNGYSNRILHILNRGGIEGLSIRNDYVMGYSGIETAVALLDGDIGRKVICIDDYVIGPEDVFESKYEKILFPVF